MLGEHGMSEADAGRQVREDLEGGWAALQEAARRVGKAAADAKMPVDVPQYVASFRPELMELLSAWARGARFADLLRSTDIFEVRLCPPLTCCCKRALVRCRFAAGTGQTSTLSAVVQVSRSPHTLYVTKLPSTAFPSAAIEAEVFRALFRLQRRGLPSLMFCNQATLVFIPMHCVLAICCGSPEV